MTTDELMFTYHWLRKTEEDQFQRFERAMGIRFKRADFDDAQQSNASIADPNADIVIPLSLLLNKHVTEWARTRYGLPPTPGVPVPNSAQRTCARSVRSTAQGEMPPAIFRESDQQQQRIQTQQRIDAFGRGISDTKSLIGQGEYIPQPNEVVITLDERVNRQQFMNGFFSGFSDDEYRVAFNLTPPQQSEAKPESNDPVDNLPPALREFWERGE